MTRPNEVFYEDLWYVDSEGHHEVYSVFNDSDETLRLKDGRDIPLSSKKQSKTLTLEGPAFRQLMPR